MVFLSALALNQSAPHIAEQLLLTLWPTAHEAIPSLRVIALIHMQKFVDALQVLRSLMVVYDENRTQKNDVISSEAVRNKHFSICLSTNNDDRKKNHKFDYLRWRTKDE